MNTPGSAFGLPMPGGVSVSHVKVYDSIGPDGLAGGTPHLHTVCTEAYLVVAGEGAVLTLSGDGYRETPLSVGTVAWFSPGTVHRLINIDGRLELYVVMSNAGLPEAGDLVVAVGPEVLADAERYRSVATLPEDATTTDGDIDPARRRRDAAVEGFGHWRSAVEHLGGADGLAPLYAAAAGIVAERAVNWSALVDGDPLFELERSRRTVQRLDSGRLQEVATDLASSALRSASLLPAPRAMGCCGTLGTVIGVGNRDDH